MTDSSRRGTLVFSGSSLYGRTTAGGFAHGGDGGCGTVFSVNSDGTSYQVLYRFNQSGSGSDGCDPRHDAPVIFNNSLYATNLGVTNPNAANPNGVAVGTGNGVIFSLPVAPSPNAAVVLRNFQGAPGDGGQQHSSFSIDSTGLFYGQSAKGGPNDKGQIYTLSGGSGKRTPIYSFSNSAAEWRRAARPHRAGQRRRFYGRNAPRSGQRRRNGVLAGNPRTGRDARDADSAARISWRSQRRLLH